VNWLITRGWLHVIEGGDKTLARGDVVVTEVSFAGVYRDRPSLDGLYRVLRSLGLHFLEALEQTHIAGLRCYA
jgi:hypothetical protein